MFIDKSRIFKFLLVGILTLFVSILHYITPYEKSLMHAIYRFLYYLPVILSAFLWGKRGGLILATIISIAYLPHIFMGWGHIALHTWVAILEIVLYFVVGLITGHLIDTRIQETKKREKVVEQFRDNEKKFSIGEITSIITHELKTPLASIQGAVHILCEDTTLSADKIPFRDILIKETQRIQELIQTTLGNLSLDRIQTESVDIIELISETKDLLTSLLQGHTFPIKIHNNLQDTHIHVDEGLFKEAMINLLRNAWEASHQEITLILHQNEERVIIQVQDQGPGIHREQQSRLFTPFYTTKHNGVGLGLPITKRIIDLHQGYVKVSSERGKGTTFTIDIPREARHV